MDKWEFNPFSFKSLHRNTVRDEWMKYKRNFDYVVTATGETDKDRIRNIFLAKGGPDLQEVFASIPGADEPKNGIDSYAVAIEKLDTYFAPKQHDTFERNLFWTLKPDPEETLVKFTLRCQEQSTKCDFGKSSEERRSISVIDKIILFAPSDLKEQLLQKDNLKIDEVMKIVSSYESVKHQARTISCSASGFSENAILSQEATSSVNRIRPSTSRECIRCGKVGHYASDPKCPARDKECNKCKRFGHFANQCRTTGSVKRKFEGPKFSNKHPRQERIREIRANTERQEDVKDKSFIFNISDGDELIRMSVGGILLQLMVDSGCKRNIIDEQSWKYLKANGVEIWNQKKECDEVFLPYGENAKPLTVLGSFDTSITIEDVGKITEKVATFYVIRGGQQCLLGRTTATELGVLFVGLPSTRGVNAVKVEEKRSFPKIKGVKVSIPIDKTFPPVCQNPRRPPIALMAKIEDKLNSLLANDIIEPVEGGCPWVSPLVTVIKDNSDIRLCVDMRRANVAILRERHLMPTIDDFLPRFAGAKYFSRLDIKEAFHQVKLDEDSRYITTFITHMGLLRYKRLMYGIVIAPEIFQRILEQVLSRCSKNAVNFIDDILIFGKVEI
ncbi:uncharacterized protein K02A2.6-like [Toxorhynchites rutilus septentrionalis]|uniref:uncharacterized protein K02A2.6-like n=1 Tax=Toxorhynchites rutilus septentrionalis TaxID=329112 RepID=UPI0024798CC8|nr:uncharacterized protein K02A2.6-like [Toxorhynchites rutilus septentrionalis]